MALIGLIALIFTFSTSVCCSKYGAISLEHDSNDLIMDLKSSQHGTDSILKIKFDFEHYDLDENDKNKIKTNLAEQFRERGNTFYEREDFVNHDKINLHFSILENQVIPPYGNAILDQNCLSVSFKANSPETNLSSCFSFQPGVNWFNSFEATYQYWPMENFIVEKRAYVQEQLNNQAVAEPYFLNSNGTFLYFSPNTTLFYSINSINPRTNPKKQREFCLYAATAAPYVRHNPFIHLNFSVCHFENSKIAHMKAVDYVLGKPRSLPDLKMVTDPIWTTWAKYKADINASCVLEYARSIKDHGFNSNSQLEIDDNWEVCYGSAVVDRNNFPNMKSTIDELRSLGFRTTMWVHPFVNLNCLPYVARFLEKQMLICSLTHSHKTSWWNSKTCEAAHFDFSKPEVVNWYINRLNNLKSEIGVDSFKFDAGESSFAPQIPKLSCPDDLHPRCLTKSYVEGASRIGGMIEIRSGAQTQYLPNFIRMLDRNSKWDFEMGLPTLITTLLMLNIAGYPFVMPDMIGGNVYAGQSISEELFIRWVQANTFMPILQFSVPPWEVGPKAVEVSKRFIDLHRDYGHLFAKIMKKTVQNGTPVNPPIWWIDPTDPIALACSDEYLLGEDILVAPVIIKGAVSRDIYLPAGLWKEEAYSRHQLINGPKWLRNYPAPLDILPYFSKLKLWH